MILLLFLYQFLTLTRVIGASFGSEPLDIRVRISNSGHHFSMRGFDLAFYELHQNQEKLVQNTNRTSQWQIECQGGKIHATHSDPDSKEKSVDLQSPVVLRSPAAFIYFENRP